MGYAYKQTLKIYHDGHHFVGHRLRTNPTCRERRKRTDEDVLFDEIYNQGVQYGYKKSAMVEYIANELDESYGVKKSPEVLSFVRNGNSRRMRNLSKRKDRFRRKAYLNKWNYFVTFTYDGKLLSEDSFKKKLRRCLANLHTRRGWKYMGVWERSPEKNRLHFHGLFYIPDEEMVGTVYEKRDYSLSEHKMQTAHVNTFFEERFGRNDFAAITGTNDESIDYMLKYLEKTGEKIVYSRGIASEIVKEVGLNDIVASFFDYILKLMLFDDVIDLEKDVYDSSPILFRDRPPTQLSMFA